MENEKTIETLNKLVEINNNRIEGYETAIKETDEQELKSLFTQLAQTSLKCKEQLASEIYNMGGDPTEVTKITGKFFRAWMDLKTALASNDRKAILSSCEDSEDRTIDTYEKVLADDEHLSFAQRSMIRNQYTIIKLDHSKVKSMRDALV